MIRLHVIIDEESDDGDAVDEGSPLDPARDAAVESDRVPAPDEADAELEELQPSHVLFPPQMSSEGRNGGESVVRVHDRMHDRVDDGPEGGLTRGYPFDPDPPEEEHRGVMIDVQKRHLQRIGV